MTPSNVKISPEINELRKVLLKQSSMYDLSETQLKACITSIFYSGDLTCSSVWLNRSNKVKHNLRIISHDFL